ncbi:LysE family translocator [Aquimarina sp. W85]|uniref:LysE family translocator n=1 Tax=Aquimarina rhodophyticola TaxID=3342246 RepID=UPI0036717096
MNYDILYTFIIATSLLAITPGPDNIFVLLQSVVNGKKYGFATIAGLMSGCIIHTTLVALGMSALIQQSDQLFFTIKILGAGYLFFLAFKVYIANSKIDLHSDTIPRKKPLQLFKQGFIMNVLNPKVSIFFLAFFPAFLFSNTLSTVAQFYILGCIFICVSFFFFGLIAVLADYISQSIREIKSVGMFLKWIQIIVFSAIGVFILLSEK